jgi:hypothetical protein
MYVARERERESEREKREREREVYTSLWCSHTHFPIHTCCHCFLFYFIQTIVAIIDLVVGVILAIFRFIGDIITSIIDKILNVFSADSSSSAATTDEDADVTGNNNNGPLLSFFPANNNNNNNDEDLDETVPALQVIYETFVKGVEGIGMVDIDQILADNADLLGGALAFGTTTAPLILTEFIGASTTNAILCLIGATESVIDGYVCWSVWLLDG